VLLSLKKKNHGFTNSNLTGTKNWSNSELEVYQSPPVRIAQLLFGGPAAAACRRIEPTLRVCDEGADCHCSLSCSSLAAIAVDLEQDQVWIP